MDIQAMRAELTAGRDQLAAGRKLVEQGLARVRAAASLVRAEIRKAHATLNTLNDTLKEGASPDERQAFIDDAHLRSALSERLFDLRNLEVGLGE